jgi:hypothetical protein
LKRLQPRKKIAKASLHQHCYLQSFLHLKLEK